MNMERKSSKHVRARRFEGVFGRGYMTMKMRLRDVTTNTIKVKHKSMIEFTNGM